MSRVITPSGVLFALAMLMLIASGTNLDAGNLATAVASGIGALLCFVAACIKDVDRP